MLELPKEKNPGDCILYKSVWPGIVLNRFIGMKSRVFYSNGEEIVYVLSRR